MADVERVGPHDEARGAGDPDRVRLGVSACLLGAKVRFDGGHKRDSFLTGTIGRFVDWVPVCPEEEAGFGTPREAMRLAADSGGLRLITVRTGQDVTAPMRQTAGSLARRLADEDLDGYVLKKDSPSCGLLRVKVYDANGAPSRSGRGLFAEALCTALPLLPVEEEGRLCDLRLREAFIERVFAYRRLKALHAGPRRAGDLMRFHARHKLFLLAHSPSHYAALGRLVAGARGRLSASLAGEYDRGFMQALAVPASRGRHVNVLQHMVGYLRDGVTAEVRQDLAQAIADYRQGLVPLIVPVTLVGHHVRQQRIGYLLDQVYLQPHPKELMLRNHV